MKELIQIAEKIINIIDSNLANKNLVLIGIDGRCAAGKTTLAAILSEQLDCNVIHMDDFFLRPGQRTATRLAIPGENVDHERFLSEVLFPLSQKEDVRYHPFNCHTMSFDNEISLPCKRINIIEGTYCCHPNLIGYYDYHLFLTVSPDEQMRRIIEREGAEKAIVFRDKWIPLEEMYFKKLEDIGWIKLEKFYGN